jgi:hypothetical protein
MIGAMTTAARAIISDRIPTTVNRRETRFSFTKASFLLVIVDDIERVDDRVHSRSHKHARGYLSTLSRECATEPSPAANCSLGLLSGPKFVAKRDSPGILVLSSGAGQSIRRGSRTDS